MDVAVFGLMRSGTTLVGDLLSTRGATMLLNEPDLFAPWHEPTVERLHRTLLDAGFDLPLDAPRRQGGETYTTYLERDLLPQLQALDLWGVKQVNFYQWQNLFQSFPPDKLILCLRDLRDVVVSSADLICRGGVAFPGVRRLRDEAWIMSRLIYGAHELLAMAQLPHLAVRYEDLVTDTSTQQRLADFAGVEQLSDERLSLKNEASGKSAWELEKHGTGISTQSLSRYEAIPHSTLKSLADRVWRLLPAYSRAFGYEMPGPNESVVDHPFSAATGQGANPVDPNLDNTWNWRGPDTLEPVFSQRRARIMAAKNIPKGSAVLDLGCAVPALRYLLLEGCSYQPSDYLARDPSYHVWDPFGEFDLSAPESNLLTAFGLLELQSDLPDFLRRVRAAERPLLVNYHASDDTPVSDPAAFGWRNHLDRHELVTCFAEADFRVSPLWAFDGQQSLFRLQPN